MTTEATERDLVTEVEELLTAPNAYAIRGEVRKLLRRLVEEVKRLRRGEFTPEEFQNLCHNTDIQAGFDAFADGCEAYQRKMFGQCRKGTAT